MTKKPAIFRLKHPDKVQEMLNLLMPKSKRVYMTDLSEICGHDVIQITHKRLAIIFTTGIVVFNSKKDVVDSIKDRSFNKFLQLDDLENKYLPLAPQKKGSKEWFLESVRYYRNLDFFKDCSHLSDVQLLDEIINHPGTNRTHHLFADIHSLSLQEMEVYLISWDKKRVWWGDMECDVYPGGKVYEFMLEDWSRISRDSFLPKNILEKWNEHTGLIELQFDMDGKHYQIELKYEDDWMDVNLVKKINKINYHSGYQFESLNVGCQALCLSVFTIDEKQRLEQERQLKFD